MSEWQEVSRKSSKPTKPEPSKLNSKPNRQPHNAYQKNGHHSKDVGKVNGAKKENYKPRNEAKGNTTSKPPPTSAPGPMSYAKMVSGAEKAPPPEVPKPPPKVETPVPAAEEKPEPIKEIAPPVKEAKTEIPMQQMAELEKNMFQEAESNEAPQEVKPAANKVELVVKPGFQLPKASNAADDRDVSFGSAGNMPRPDLGLQTLASNANLDLAPRNQLQKLSNEVQTLKIENQRILQTNSQLENQLNDTSSKLKSEAMKVQDLEVSLKEKKEQVMQLREELDTLKKQGSVQPRYYDRPPQSEKPQPSRSEDGGPPSQGSIDMPPSQHYHGPPPPGIGVYPQVPYYPPNYYQPPPYGGYSQSPSARPNYYVDNQGPMMSGPSPPGPPEGYDQGPGYGRHSPLPMRGPSSTSGGNQPQRGREMPPSQQHSRDNYSYQQQPQYGYQQYNMYNSQQQQPPHMLHPPQQHPHNQRSNNSGEWPSR